MSDKPITIEPELFELVSEQIMAISDAMRCIEELAEVASVDVAVHRNLPVLVDEVARSCKNRSSFVSEALRTSAQREDSIAVVPDNPQ